MMTDERVGDVVTAGWKWALLRHFGLTGDAGCERLVDQVAARILQLKRIFVHVASLSYVIIATLISLYN